MDVPGDFIENHTFEEIRVGDHASLQRTLTPADIQLFAIMSGDVNPAHVDPEYAKASSFHEVIAHGMWGGSLISTVLGTLYPGPGTIYIDQTLHFSRPVTIGDTLTVNVTVKEKFERTRHVVLDCECVNQDGRAVIRGTAEVLAPTQKVRRPRAHLPEVRLRDPRAMERQLIERARAHAPVVAVVAWPVHAEALAGILAAAGEGLIRPVLVGDRTRIEAAARGLGASLDGLEIVEARGERESAATAVALAREGEAGILVKGSLRTDLFIAAVLAAGEGLRTDRRLSHVALLDAPELGRLLLVTDGLVHVTPTLADKRDIAQNAIDLARALGIAQPRVAVLAAVRTINPKMPATVDAAALCKMAERGQIERGLIDGPFTLDDAVSLPAAKANAPLSAVAGRADVLLVPDIEAGAMLTHQLETLAGASAAGIVVGARVPIVLAHRDEPSVARLASCALAVLAAQPDLQRSST